MEQPTSESTLISTAPNVTTNAAPSNDNFADSMSIPLTGDFIVGRDFIPGGDFSNIEATGEEGEPNHASDSEPLHSVWYNWTAPTNGLAIIDTFESDYDTTLGVYTGSTVDSLTEITSNDDDNDTLTSEVLFEATAGTTYQIAIDGFSDSTGNITFALAFSELEPPANDDFADSIALSGSSVTVTGYNYSSTGEEGEPNHGSNPTFDSTPLDSVWYNWTAPTDGLFSIDTYGSSFSAYLGIYTGSSIDSLTEVDSIDSSSISATGYQVQFQAVAGTTYQIAVDGRYRTIGNITLNINESQATLGNDNIVGTSQSDFIHGLTGNDTIAGRGGDDAINGYDGDDELFGDGGNDDLDGGDGNDELFGGGGNDDIFGDVGNDTIKGQAGDDDLHGGDGDDKFFGGNGNDTVFGNADNDTIKGQAGNDYLVGAEGDDELFGGGGNDILFGDVDNEGNDRLFGGDDDDTLWGGSGDDLLKGQDGNDTLSGDPGDDKLFGGSGNDDLQGKLGNDRLFGGSGDDTLNGTIFGFNGGGGIGERDQLTGSAGSDTFILGTHYDDDADSIAESKAGQAIIKDFVIGEDIIQLSDSGSYELFETNSGSTQIREVSDTVPEVIATITGVTGLDLGDSSQFTFI